MDAYGSDLEAWRASVGTTPSGVIGQNQLFWKRVSTVYTSKPNGADIAFMCEVAEGGTYYCKEDSGPRTARLNEWFCTNLARHLGIPTAACAIIENDEGHTYFGSLRHHSTVDDFLVKKYLSTPRLDELGSHSGWLGRFLAGLWAFDMCLDNYDRDYGNFVLWRDGSRLVLAPIDFASAQPLSLPTARFAVAPMRTILVGRILRKLHGSFDESAVEMTHRIAAVPIVTIRSILTGIPDDWASAAQKEAICDAWTSGRLGSRLAALRAGLEDGTLL
jgi:hypothetical protein